MCTPEANIFFVCVFAAVASTVKQALQESLVQILQPKRRVDILRDVMEAQSQRRPFVITFCGVNGVGKSTNLAKVRKHCQDLLRGFLSFNALTKALCLLQVTLYFLNTYFRKMRLDTLTVMPVKFSTSCPTHC